MFKFTKSSEGIGILTIDQPESSANLINEQFLKEFLPTLKKIFFDTSLKGLIIASAKKGFVAGGDLEFIQGMKSLEGALEFIKLVHEGFNFLETNGKPVVAALTGTALGGGLELALACHYRICLDDSKIQLGLPEVTLGLLPGGGGTQRLPRLIGIQPALELLTLGSKIDPKKAQKLGIVNELAETREKLMEQASVWILKNSQAQQPWYDKKFKIPGGGIQTPLGYQVFAASNAMVAEKTYHNYPAPKAILNSVYEGLQVPFEQGLKIEAQYFAQLIVSPISKNMIKTLFYGISDCNKGAARPKEVAPSPSKKVGVLGAGMMGAGIAYATAKAGISVVLKDISVEAAEKGKSYSENICNTLVEKGRMTAEQKSQLLGLIQVSSEPGSVRDCDLVIETVIEDRKIKARVTQESEEVISPKAIMASNTSTLPISGLAAASKRPQQFIGLHFFSPVDKMPLVEIILGEKSNPESLAKCIDYVQQIKKTPIVVNDGRGFYTSRVFTTYIAEGINLLKDGVAPSLIESAGKFCGMPVGPLAVADEVSIDLIYHILKQTAEDIGEQNVEKAVFDTAKLFVEKLKRLGRKSKGGFYEYPADGKKQLWKGLNDHFKLSEKQPELNEVKERLLTIQALESVRCLEDKILTSKRDGDVGSILGWGFPAYTGGALSYVEMVGAQEFANRCERFAKQFGARFKANTKFILSNF